MKQKFAFLCVAAAVVAGITVVIADEDDFIDNLKNCTNYYENQSIILQDLKLTTVREIHGWKEGKCAYTETVSLADKDYTVNCKFSQNNINELVKIMEDFNGSQENNKIDLNDYEQVQNSSVSTAWTKYLQNPDICSVQMK